jgi:hypothetical protein
MSMLYPQKLETKEQNLGRNLQKFLHQYSGVPYPKSGHNIICEWLFDLRHPLQFSTQEILVRTNPTCYCIFESMYLGSFMLGIKYQSLSLVPAINLKAIKAIKQSLSIWFFNSLLAI